jgi:L-rhamnose mutarotase
MDALRKLQHEFLGYLLDDSAVDIVERIESSPQCSADQRLAFYSNAYRLRLKEALTTDYERLHSYLGDELFEKLMQCYIDNYPSHHPSLRYFGQYMIELVEQLEPFNQLAEIAEITRIEQAFANSFDAADCPCVSFSQLAELDPAAWATLTLSFHDAVQLLPQHYNSFQIWRALANEEIPPQKTADETTWLIWRQDLVSRYRALESAELAALKIAISGGNFADVCAALLEYFSEQQTPQQAVAYLQQWINDQMVCELN